VADLDTIRDGWDHAAREDAMGNIVTLPQYQGGGWPEDEFFAHGQREIDALLDHLDGLGLRGPRRDRALDFGCGVGRLTQALALEYLHVIGADVSAEMVKRARELNRRGDHVTYVNTGERLLDSFALGHFDLIYSRITLQHMPADLQHGYVREFVKLLAPEGLAVFQIPDGPDYQHPNGWLSMYGVPRALVEQWVLYAGAKLLDVELLEDGSGTWDAYRYTVTPA
jgi:SAM-dependent methyltransferase